jgi:hypothetical protein
LRFLGLIFVILLIVIRKAGFIYFANTRMKSDNVEKKQFGEPGYERKGDYIY